MLGGNNNNTLVPVFLDENGFQYPSNASSQLQLFKNVPVGCNVDPINYSGREHNSPVLRPNKRGREVEVNLRQQKCYLSLNHNICGDDSDHAAAIPNQNPVSTGLRLSYDDEERNSSITSASGSMTAAPSVMMPFGDSITTELDRQREEFELYLKTQEENMVKGVRDLKQRHLTSFLAAIEKGVGQKIRDKDLEIETINHRNRELVERIKHVANEVQNWHYRAKYNESVINILKTNIQQALAQGVDQAKEGFGDTDIDDTASCIDPSIYVNIGNNVGKIITEKGEMICRACNAKEVSFLLMPCRHLSLCKDCEGSVDLCPVCKLVKTGSVEVYLS